MSILVTGDTHGEAGLGRFKNDAVKRLNLGELPGHIIIAGDFGLIWSNNPEDRTERYWLDWLDGKAWDTVVVPGNHENYERIYQMPVLERWGAPVYQCSERVFFLQHGRIYTIEGRSRGIDAHRHN